MEMKSILNSNKRRIALLIGNGINQYQGRGGSWEELLEKLSEGLFDKETRKIAQNVSLTEFYDLVDLLSNEATSTKLQNKFCDLMSSWGFGRHHSDIVAWARHNKVPILTTNFEDSLSRAGDCSLRRLKKARFTDYYPWDSYYSSNEIQSPCDEFAIWHVNGMRNYPRSIRLGLSHYMGSVEKARKWLHKGGGRRLFSGVASHDWDGALTWLHMIFHSPLLIFGLKLEENEVFMRWLLIERARYFKKFGNYRQPAWFVYKKSSENREKNFFLKSLGVTPVSVADYSDVYGPKVWELSK